MAVSSGFRIIARSLLQRFAGRRSSGWNIRSTLDSAVVPNSPISINMNEIHHDCRTQQPDVDQLLWKSMQTIVSDAKAPVHGSLVISQARVSAKLPPASRNV